MKHRRSAGIALPILSAAAIVSVAHAQDMDVMPDDGSLSAKQYVVKLGGGPVLTPKYPGAGSYVVSPFPIIAIERFYVPGFGQIGDSGAKEDQFSVFPSFGFNGERKASDSNDLTGTRKVDWAVELGLGASYRHDWLLGFVKLRQGINGHTGQVADIGFDVITNPTERLQLTFGPRATWGSDDYMQTYFGVSAAEAAAPGSRLKAYDADAGFKSLGLAAQADYDLTGRTAIQLRAGWDRLVGDAAKSPITKEGSDNQFTVGAGISYKFGFDIFD